MGVDESRHILPIGRRKGGTGPVIGDSGEYGERGGGKDGDGDNTGMRTPRTNTRTYTAAMTAILILSSSLLGSSS